MHQWFVRNTATRAVALAVACVLLLCGVLGLRHQADGLHIRDQRTGVMLHAQAMSGAHVEGESPDIHGRVGDHDADDGVCAVDLATHQAAAKASAGPALAPAVRPQVRMLALVADHATCRERLLTDAPKTSPPAVA